MRVGPSEVLANEKTRFFLENLNLSLKITELPDWHFDSEKGEKTLKKLFGLSTLAAWSLESETEILSSVNALLDYVDQTQCEATPHIEPLNLQNESAFIGLDPATRRNLEIDSSLHEGDGATLFRILDTCKTGMGSRRLRTWITQPLRDSNIAKTRHEAIGLLLKTPHLIEELLSHIKTLPDIERIAGRIALRSIRPKEAAALRDALPEIESLKQSLQSHRTEAELFRKFIPALSLNPMFYARLKDILLEDPASFLREGDVIRSEADAELAEQRKLRDNAGDFLAQLEVKERERTGISTLRVEYNQVSGYYIEVSRGHANNVPEDYRRRQTLKNSERFITPELKEFEDKALSAKERARQIEKRLWDRLVLELNEFVPTLLEAAQALSSLDALIALTRHAIECNWTCPEFNTTNSVEIRQGRHPVIEKVIDSYVPNDCVLGPGRRLLVITGPNMGGKSTYMRSVALIVLLAYAGSYVPAKSARIGTIDKILTRIGASDDLARGRSTFMVEMTEAATILHQATDHSLVLMDEIGRGTSTYDGLSLAAAIACDLAERSKSLTLFATHYFELTQLVHTLKESVNIHVCAEQVGNNVVFLHDIKEGPASRSYGIAVAKLAGIRPSVIRRASSYLRQLENRAFETKEQPDLFSSVNLVEEEFDAQTSEEAKKLKDYVEAASEIDVDALSPREAMNLVYEMRESAKKILSRSPKEN